MTSQSSGLIGLRLEITCVNIALVISLVGKQHVIKRCCIASDLRKVSIIVTQL